MFWSLRHRNYFLLYISFSSSDIRCRVMEVDSMSEDEDSIMNENVTYVELNCLSTLKSLHIGDECFSNVSTMILNNLTCLSSFFVGTHSFSRSSFKDMDAPNKAVQFSNPYGIKTLFLGNLPVLLSITIGYQSFADFTSFSIQGCPSLESISIGGSPTNLLESCNFYFCSSFALKNLKSLSRFSVVGHYAFHSTELVLQNLPSLELIEIRGHYSFLKTSVLRLLSFPSLRKLNVGGTNAFSSTKVLQLADVNDMSVFVVSGHSAFSLVSDLNFENIEHLTRVTISGDQAFLHTECLQLIDLPRIKQLLVSGKEAFHECRHLTLRGLCSLRSLEISGNGAFASTHTVTFDDLPSLTTVEITGTGCIQAMFNTPGTFVMRDIPNVTNIVLAPSKRQFAAFYYFKRLKRGVNVSNEFYYSIQQMIKKYGMYRSFVSEEFYKVQNSMNNYKVFSCSL